MKASVPLSLPIRRHPPDVDGRSGAERKQRELYESIPDIQIASDHCYRSSSPGCKKASSGESLVKRAAIGLGLSEETVELAASRGRMSVGPPQSRRESAGPRPRGSRLTGKKLLSSRTASQQQKLYAFAGSIV